MSDDPYTYPGSIVLINKPGIRDPELLDWTERQAVRLRTLEGTPAGDFDLAHLRAIHRHLFQDIYDWAGEVRTVEIAKGGTQFMPFAYIETGIADVHRRVIAARRLTGLDAVDFAGAAAEIIGDVNHVHPFREGNGRTQLEYLRQLCAGAGHPFRPARLDGPAWHAASRAAHLGHYGLMASAILGAIG